MRAGYFDHTLTLSVQIYVNNVVRELKNLGVEMIPFKFGEPLPEGMDVYWDPRVTGTSLPTALFNTTNKPCVVTFHGAPVLSLWPWEYFRDVKSITKKLTNICLQVIRWRRLKGRYAAIITVSHSAKVEIERGLGLRGDNIVPIHHGIDHKLFQPRYAGEGGSYFVHVSHYSPKKNVDRMIAAYCRLLHQNRPDLVAVIPGYAKAEVYEGIRVIRDPLSHEELAALYQNATGFILPSLWESFGMPIIEAMACGCPVITSNVTACPEVAGDAALLVNPRSVDDIANAMRRLIEEPDLRRSLREKGIARAQLFSWRKCAQEHLRVFEQVLS